jgi:hypothetical protein
MFPRVMAEYQSGNLATTETRQPFTSGNLRVTLVFDASGPERATILAPTSTATAVAVMARPFTTISVAAECRFCGRAAEEVWGAGAVDATGAEVGAPGSGAGTVSAELGGDVAGAATGGVGAAGSSATGDGAAGGGVT